MTYVEISARLQHIVEAVDQRVFGGLIEVYHDIPAEYQICHGDFNPSNIVLTRDDELYLLDWSHASQGNAAADAANAWLWFRLAGDAQGADRYLELFCQKTGMEPAMIQKWIPIVAAARSAEGGERERTFLLKLVNGEDYE